MKYFIKTFGCQQNSSDSERIAADYQSRGMKLAKNYQDANVVVINTCMVRESAENRVYGLVNNLKKLKQKKIQLGEDFKIVVTGCMVGIACRDKTGKYLKKIQTTMPEVDQFMPIEEVGFDHLPLYKKKDSALVNISNGCNNFCSYCIVPYTRGKEASRSYEAIIDECNYLKANNYQKITLLGQNVNSYGADLVLNKSIKTKKKPVFVKHLGKHRIPTLFPQLLEEIAQMGFKEVDFLSSNPWDFSDELIDVISKNKNITRTIHLPVQSGDDQMLIKMNRWYSAQEYFFLVKKLKTKIPEIKFTTDIIVGFCGETNEQFENTVNLVKKVGFEKAYISRYSPRAMTFSHKSMTDDISPDIKKERWQILDDLINKK